MPGVLDVEFEAAQYSWYPFPSCPLIVRYILEFLPLLSSDSQVSSFVVSLPLLSSDSQVSSIVVSFPSCPLIDRYSTPVLSCSDITHFSSFFTHSQKPSFHHVLCQSIIMDYPFFLSFFFLSSQSQARDRVPSHPVLSLSGTHQPFQPFPSVPSQSGTRQHSFPSCPFIVRYKASIPFHPVLSQSGTRRHRARNFHRSHPSTYSVQYCSVTETRS